MPTIFIEPIAQLAQTLGYCAESNAFTLNYYRSGWPPMPLLHPTGERRLSTRRENRMYHRLERNDEQDDRQGDENRINDKVLRCSAVRRIALRII